MVIKTYYQLYQVDAKGMIEYLRHSTYYGDEGDAITFDTEEEALVAMPDYQSWSVQKLYVKTP